MGPAIFLSAESAGRREECHAFVLCGGLKVAETLPFRRSNVDGLTTFLPFEEDEARLQTLSCNFVAVSLLNWHHFGDVIGCENHRV